MRIYKEEWERWRGGGEKKKENKNAFIDQKLENTVD